MIDRETIERIKESARVEEVVGDFVSLHKKGGNYWGCCPFHNEKTPSFSVSPAKGFYKCFGCGESGNAIGFLMKHERYTYVEALQWLAKKYNIEIVEKELSEDQKRRNSERDTLYHVSEFAQQYFADLLYNDDMGRAVGLSYFHNRGLSDEIIKEFGLGYCLDEWSAFTDHARKNGYSDAVLEKTGLSIMKDNGRAIDRFKGRVTFPIYSISGRVLGFSCRILSNDKKLAKYVNSPDSEIYNKSNILYGILQAKKAIGDKDKCYLVEGNVDVLSMHQSGVKNTVASCGTALTTEQIRLIRRYTQNVTVVYDGDAAGIKATNKAVGKLYAEGMKVRTVLFPDGDDPDSYAQKYGSTKLQEYLETHEENFVLYKMKVAEQSMLKDPIRKSDFLREMVATIAIVPDMLEQNEYVKQCASLFGTSEQALHSQLAVAMNNRRLEEAKAEHEAASAQPQAPAPVLQPGADDGYVPLLEPGPEDYEPIAPKEMEMDISERHLIELLVSYGTHLIKVDAINDNNEPMKVELMVAQVIVMEMEGDEQHFDHPLAQKIYDIFRDAVLEEREVPDAQYFVLNEDEQLQREAISFMIEPQELSPVWAEKHVSVKNYINGIGEDVRQSVLNFKLHKVDAKIAELDRKLKMTTDMQELMMLVSEKQALVELRCRLNRPGNLGRVVT